MRRNDLLLAGGVVLFACLLLLGRKLWFAGERGGTVAVYQEGRLVASYPLQDDVETWFYASGGGCNLLVIQGGEAWIGEADCPDGLCMKQGRIRGSRETLTCLPHRLSVTVTGGEDAALDGMVR